MHFNARLGPSPEPPHINGADSITYFGRGWALHATSTSRQPGPGKQSIAGKPSAFKSLKPGGKPHHCLSHILKAIYSQHCLASEEARRLRLARNQLKPFLPSSLNPQIPRETKLRRDLEWLCLAKALNDSVWTEKSNLLPQHRPHQSLQVELNLHRSAGTCSWLPCKQDKEMETTQLVDSEWESSVKVVY